MAASSKQMLLLAVVVAAVASLASATQWMVGDEGGWRAAFNQTGWTDGKTFRVGDSLSTHARNGMKLDKKPGKVWFICNKPNHWLNGMKLVVDVVGGNTAPAPPPLSLLAAGPSGPQETQSSSAAASHETQSPFPFWGPAPTPAPETSSSPSPIPFPFPFWGPAPAPSPESSSPLRFGRFLV